MLLPTELMINWSLYIPLFPWQAIKNKWVDPTRSPLFFSHQQREALMICTGILGRSATKAGLLDPKKFPSLVTPHGQSITPHELSRILSSPSWRHADNHGWKVTFKHNHEKTKDWVTQMLRVIDWICSPYGEQAVVLELLQKPDLEVHIIGPQSVKVNKMEFDVLCSLCNGTNIYW